MILGVLEKLFFVEQNAGIGQIYLSASRDFNDTTNPYILDRGRREDNLHIHEDGKYICGGREE